MCDTFVSVNEATTDGSVIFGKNSDREPNEAQILEYVEPASHKAGEQAECTYIKIPQVKNTLGVLLSRPFWMPGAEMGANEKGVVIGNEAVFTKMPVKKSGTLTGMDLLRLALERSDSAENAIETIISLIADYGQGGVCGLYNKKMTYHNSFIIADPSGAWVLETAGYMWAALKVKGYYSISNGLTIGEKYDRSHPDLIKTARLKGWLKKGKTFNFKECYSDWLYTTFSGSGQRRAFSCSSLKEKAGSFSVRDAFGILRSHPDKDRRADRSVVNTRLCVHGANGITKDSQTAGSLVAHLRKEDPLYWVTAASSPCIGVFKPLRFEGDVLPDLGPAPSDKYDPETYWWKHEALHRELIKDFSRIRIFEDERNRMEEGILSRAYASGAGYSLTAEAFAEAAEAEARWLEAVKAVQPESSRSLIFRNYWKNQNRKSNFF